MNLKKIIQKFPVYFYLIVLVLLAGSVFFSSNYLSRNETKNALKQLLKSQESISQPVGQTGSWNMVFEDNFDGTQLNLMKWRPNWLGSSDTSITTPINILETSCYNPNNVTVNNGTLVLTARTATESGCNTRNEVAKYSSGMIESYNKFDFTYGYIEASIWNPAGTGVWPAFWTDGSGLNWPTTGEIDTMECYGTDASCSYHYHYSGGGPGGNSTVIGSTTGFHTYAADWEPGSITWYYDGKQVWQYTTGIISVPQFIILNLGLQSTSSTVPSKMIVDYVRVWKQGSGTPTPIPVTIDSPIPTPSPTSASIVSNNDTTSPEVNITTPLAGSTVGRKVNINVTAADVSGIYQILIYIDSSTSANKTCSYTTSCGFSWNRVSSGNHTIRARAYDNSTNRNWKEVSISVTR